MGSSFGSAFRHALLRLRRGWRSGELLVLGLALAVASAAMVSVGMFSGRVQQAIEHGSGEALGADAIIKGRDPYPADFAASLRKLGLKTVALTEFASVVATSVKISQSSTDHSHRCEQIVT